MTAAGAVTAAGPLRRRQKKGPKRVKKSVDELDQEMEDYRAEIAPAEKQGS